MVIHSEKNDSEGLQTGGEKNMIIWVFYEIHKKKGRTNFVSTKILLFHSLSYSMKVYKPLKIWAFKLL